MLNRLTDKIYYMDYVTSGDRPILGLIVGDEYSLVIDGGNSKKHAEQFLNEVKKLNIPPLKYLVLTHAHWDHVFGIKTMNLITIAQEKSNEKLKEMKELKWTNEDLDKRVSSGEEIEFSKRNIKIEFPCNDRSIEISTADVVFEDYLELDLGNLKVEVIHVNCDHSEDSCIIYIPNEKTVFLGDSIYLDMYNGNWSYTKEKLYRFLDKLESYKAKYYLPSHNNKYDYTSFKELSNYLKYIGDLVGNSTSLEESCKDFEYIIKREITEEEMKDIKAFVEGNIKNLNKLV